MSTFPIQKAIAFIVANTHDIKLVLYFSTCVCCNYCEQAVNYLLNKPDRAFVYFNTLLLSFVVEIDFLF